MNTLTVSAIILGRKNFGEADRLIFCFSQELGKIKVLAKGCRKLKSKMAPHIEPFTIGKYFLVQGKSSYILAGAEATQQNQKLSEDIESYRDASYLCELIEIVSEENQPNAQIFEVAKDTLSNLSAADPVRRSLLLRYFEFVILESSGYRPNYHTCKHCESKLEERDYYFGNFEGVTCDSCCENGRKISKNTFKIMRFFEKNGADKIIQLNASSHDIEDLQAVILPYLYDILPRKPKSYKL